MQSLRQFDKTIEEEKVIYFDFDDPDWYDWLYSEGCILKVSSECNVTRIHIHIKNIAIEAHMN